MMDALTHATLLLSRLQASASLVALAAGILPRLIAGGEMSPAEGKVVLDQIPALAQDVQEQISQFENSVEAVQDRVEILGQFLLLHRRSLTPNELASVKRLLAKVRGKQPLDSDQPP